MAVYYPKVEPPASVLWLAWRRAMDMITDVLQNVAASYPIGSGVAVLAAVWYALVCLRERAGDASVGGCVTEEGIRQARERQQAALAQAATARAQFVSAPAAPSAPKSPAPTAGGPASEMPERMRVAAARRAAADAAVAGTSGTAGAAKSAVKGGSNDKNSVTQRLARLQEGKGDKNSNPLMGPEAGKGSSSSGKPCRKKGG